jgi:hypothetical protein
VKVVKAKNTILQGARACARARNLDFTFVKAYILSTGVSCCYEQFNA